MTRNENIVSAAIFAYSMIRWPVFAIPVALGFACRYRRLQEFTLSLALSLIVTTAASAALPAIGVYSEAMLTASDAAFQSPAYVEYLHQIAAVRNGSLRELDLMQLAGIVTFPSFHAASAVIFLWALWSVWWMRPVAAITMGAMLVVTPFVGGHYFIDIIAGVAVAVISIAAARWIGRWILSRGLRQNAAAPIAVATGASLAGASNEHV